MLHAFIDLSLSTDNNSAMKMGNRKPANSVKSAMAPI
jgi:hypothetical protein